MLVVFAGPSLAGVDRDRWREAGAALEIRPPAQQGDVLAAVGERPWAIGLVDGYFEWVPAVWHKEILWAMSEGVHVYGSASMGALRASELSPFGMRGVGWVYERYADGTLDADDEVTLVHADGADGYRPLSEPLVNTRASLSAAADAGIVPAAAIGPIVERLRSIHYPDRTRAAVEETVRQVLGARESDALLQWLSGREHDVKQTDAIEMVDVMIEDWTTNRSPFRSSFRFEHTDAWQQVLRQVASAGAPSQRRQVATPHDAVLDELRLRPQLQREVRAEALNRSLAEWVAEGTSTAPSPALLEDAVRAFWARQPSDQRDLDAWLERHRLSEHELVALIERDASTRFVRSVAESELDQSIADVVALRGLRHELVDRAERKQADLDEVGMANPTLAEAGITEDALWSWFFAEVMGASVPPDLPGAALQLGFPSVTAMRRVALREYVWTR